MILRPFDPRTSHFVPPALSHEDEASPLPTLQEPASISDALRASYREADLTYDDLLPYRSFAAWRLIRRLAEWKAVLQPGETLIEALAPCQSNPDPWAIPELFTKPRPGRSQTFQQARHSLVPPEVIRLHQDAEGLNPGFLPTSIPSIPLLPPPIPSACYPVETYNPDRDPLLRFYIACLKHVARSLDILAGSSEMPNMGKWGLAGLLDLWHIRTAFPSRFQIVAIEQALIEETLSLLTGSEKQIGAEARLHRQYGLDRTEVISLIRMAKAEAYARTQGDLEHDRALMLLRLEAFCQRCHESLDLRTELLAMKHMAVVLGLARAETGDMMSDMAEVVRTVSQERSRPLLEREE